MCCLTSVLQRQSGKLTSAESSPWHEGEVYVVRMNNYGTVTETSTSPDLRVIPDFSHLVQLRMDAKLLESCAAVNINDID